MESGVEIHENKYFHNYKIKLHFSYRQNFLNQFDLDQLREITNTSIDTSYTFTPTKKEFKKFIKSGGFKNNIVYYKVK